MKKIILALGILAGSCQISFGQSVGNVIFECAMGIEENFEDKSLNCSNTSQLYQTYYNRYDFYRNSYDIRPTVTIPININVWQKDDGTENWQDIEEHKNRLKQIINWVNAFYEDVELPSDPIPGVIELRNSKIHFELNEIYFYQNSTMWQTASANNLHNSMVAVDPLRANQLNIHITGYDSGTSVLGHAALPKYATSRTHFVVTYHNEAEPADIGNDWGFAKHLAHELGHNLDLGHTYDPGICDQTNPYYLDDVFGIGAGVICPHIGTWGCDAYAAGSNCTNNMMGGTPASRYLSPKQIYSTQLALSLKSIWRYVKCEDYGLLPPIEIATDQLWDFEIRLYNPILVKRGATLTIACKLFMNMGHTITVEPGAKLIIDGGTITSSCDDFWQGIEVWGDASKPQTDANQGVVELKNGAIIENAKEAINLWKPDNWASTGGIVRATNSIFRNNWRSAQFLYYHSYGSGGKEIKNKSFFTNCSFEWDANYTNLTIAPAITMYHVNGVRIAGCDFTDNRADTPMASGGVHSIDAGFTVEPITLIGTTQGDNDWYDETGYDVCKFTKVNAAIRVSNATALTNVTVDRCHFIENRAGIELSALDNILITRNWFDHCYAGVTGFASTAYTIEGNQFDNLSANEARVATYIENSGTEANMIYRNRINKTFYGNFANGSNANDETSLAQASGLQWHCQFNNGNILDLYNRTFSSTSDPNIGVRLFQGKPGQSTGNTFSPNILPGGLSYDYHISTDDVQLMRYYAYDNPTQIPTQLNGSVSVNVNLNQNTCSSTFKPISGSGGHVVGKLSGAGKSGVISELQIVTDLIAQRNQELRNLMLEGNRNELHVLISTLNKTNKTAIRSVLQQESPFLSEEVLRELGNKPSHLFPHEWYKDLVLLNLEVAQNRNFRSFLREKPEPMPQGLYDEIVNKSSKGLTARGEREIEILELNTRKEALHNELLNDALAQDEEIDWSTVDQLLNGREHALLNTEQVDRLLAQNKQAEAVSALQQIELQAASMPLGFNKRSLEDFVLFKRYTLSLMQTNGQLKTFSSNEIADLEFMAENLNGKAARQARNLLCFFAGRCTNLELENLQVSKGKGNDKSLWNEVNAVPAAGKENQQNELQIIPNPNQGRFEINLPEGCSLKSIELSNAEGKKINFEQSTNETAKVNVTLSANKKGIYLLEVQCADGSVHRSRMLLLD